MHYKFDRKIDALAQVFEQTRSFYSEQAIGEDDALAIDLAIEELFTNLVRHQPPECGDVEVCLESDGNEVRVELSGKELPPYDPTATPEPDVTQALDEREPGGLGVHLTRQVVDAFTYRYENGVGQTTIRRKLQSPKVT